MQIITAFFQPSPTKKEVKPISELNFEILSLKLKSCAITGTTAKKSKTMMVNNRLRFFMEFLLVMLILSLLDHFEPDHLVLQG